MFIPPARSIKNYHGIFIHLQKNVTPKENCSGAENIK